MTCVRQNGSRYLREGTEIDQVCNNSKRLENSNAIMPGNGTESRCKDCLTAADQTAAKTVGVRSDHGS